MQAWELIVIALGVSMDAFAVAVGKGLASPAPRLRHALLVGLYFGGFQALMPLLGYLAGSGFGELVTTYDHWIAFALLAFIGLRMIVESRSAEGAADPGLGAATMLTLAVATSIDALAVGVSFAFLEVAIVPAVALIGLATFGMSAIGFRLGTVFGNRYRSHAELFGGVVLVAIGARILLEHLGVPG